MSTVNTLADAVYLNAHIYTADKNDTIYQAIAIRDGYIIALGANDEIKKYCTDATRCIDLNGKMVLPGIIDSHMHPFWGGKQLLGCHLNYESLTVEQTLERIQQHLDQDPLQGESDWLQVRAWLRQGMLPVGTDITRFDLDRLNTKRPVILFSNDCHTLAANSRALELFGIDENTPIPPDGNIARDEQGILTGILEDAPAMRAFDSIPSFSPAQEVIVAERVQQVLHREGVTTVMDTRVFSAQLDAFSELKRQGKLYLRVLGAKEVTPDSVPDVASVPAAIQDIVAFAERYNPVEWTPEADVSVHHVKFFVDGVLQPPTMTARLLQPYRYNQGSVENPDWQESEDFGDLYFTEEILDALIMESARAGLHPHMHTVADGAIEVTLNAIEKMRQAFPEKDIRPALAHNELVASHQFKRFADLGAIPVLSFQWAGLPAALIETERGMLGETRFEGLEPAAKFIDAGARLAFGSDWPIDALDEWYDFQVAMTRRALPVGEELSPRLDNDRNLTLKEVLRSATIDAAYALGRENYIGSLEVGKFADLIVIDRDLFTTPATEISQVNVLLTVIGGKEVYHA